MKSSSFHNFRTPLQIGDSNTSASSKKMKRPNLKCTFLKKNFELLDNFMDRKIKFCGKKKIAGQCLFEYIFHLVNEFHVFKKYFRVFLKVCLLMFLVLPKYGNFLTIIFIDNFYD